MWPTITASICLIGCCLVVTCSPEIENYCISDNYKNGCNVLQFTPFKLTFTPACNKHDVCYFCGEKYNWSRQICDSAFFQDMTSICSAQYKRQWVHRVTCDIASYLYYTVVRLFGGFFRSKISPIWCKAGCALLEGDPIRPK